VVDTIGRLSTFMAETPMNPAANAIDVIRANPTARRIRCSFTLPETKSRTVCVSCAALCLGIAQAATDTLLELAASKVQVDPFPAMRDRPALQVMVASAAANLLQRDFCFTRRWPMCGPRVLKGCR
jgi:hypothetical protein